VSAARPSSRPPTLLEVRDRMRARNEEHARAEGLYVVPRGRPLPARELAAQIQRDNAARAKRFAPGGEEKEFARVEILRVCDSLAPEIARAQVEAPAVLTGFCEMVGLFQAAVGEYLRADGPEGSPVRSTALQAMREAVASLDKARGR
jgi:hypothetical protein